MCSPADTANKTGQARRVRNFFETGTQEQGRGRGRERSQNRGDRSNSQKRKQVVNGVNITGRIRYYTGDESDKLPSHTKTIIWEAKKRKRGQNNNNGQKQRRAQATD